MSEKVFCKNKVEQLLIDIDYFNNFRTNFLCKKYENINYGKRIGTKNFECLIDAAIQYSYAGKDKINDNEFENWTKTLRNPEATDAEIFRIVIEIFDWGKVWNGNISNALELYKKNQIKNYICQITKLLDSNEVIDSKTINSLAVKKLYFSSGWSKVYSFINNNIVIYDSRVSAFLNHSLTYNYNYSDNQISKLKELTGFLYNFGGNDMNNDKRERLVDKTEFGFNNAYPNGLNGFNANLVSSWIIQLIKKKLNLPQEIKLLEQAFFMLGFDLKQI